MRILFLSSGKGPDYQCDMLFHGLRCLFGNEVVDSARLSYMYKHDFPQGSRAKQHLYGRGFSIYGLLDSDDDVDRTEIRRKISSRFYDLIIFGSIRRCANYLFETLESYESSKVIFIDGEDDQEIEKSLLGRGLYFKREMNAPVRCGFPIQFAIPAEKIITSDTPKLKANAYIDPRDRNTYIYETEDEYYRDYQQSLFGVTMKKAGWDCLRHYEIMANRCIPDFKGLENCPTWTMPFLPKLELIEVSRLIAKHGPEAFEAGQGRSTWNAIETRIQGVLQRHLTTEALARYIISISLRPDRNLGTMM